jgi:hypothetical protein
MLTADCLLAWFQRFNLPEQGRSTTSHIRSACPARRVGGGKSNVAGRYPSRKMGVTIQFESHRVELAGIYEMEHDVGVLEYFDQPSTIKLDYESPDGKRMGVLHTRDFFVIREKEAGWEEWKTEADLQRLTATLLSLSLSLSRPHVKKPESFSKTTKRLPSVRGRDHLISAIFPSSFMVHSGRPSRSGSNWTVPVVHV